MHISTLRKLANREEIDYQFLMDALKDYACPRDKVTQWLRSGDLIRIKKGLYIFGKHIALGLYSKELLANLIYGPSAISLSYALAYYGLIPERVSVVTNITPKRYKHFTTPVGDFTYYYLPLKKYSIGIELKTSSQQQTFLMAIAEKALCDQIIIQDKKLKFKSLHALEQYLFYDLRLDEDVFCNLSIEKLSAISLNYNNEKLNLLTQLLMKMKK